MQKKYINGFLQSVIILPILTVNMSGLGVQSISIQPFATQAKNKIALISQPLADKAEMQAKREKEALIEKRGEMIDAFFASVDAPLEGYGKKMVEEAEKNGLEDWRLLAAISFIESTAGKYPCYNDPNNVFGYGSCTFKYNSIDEAIESVARNIAGNNPATEYYYKNKTIIGKLKSYNSVIPTYAKKIFSTMDKIGPLDDSSLVNDKKADEKEIAMASFKLTF